MLCHAFILCVLLYSSVMLGVCAGDHFSENLSSQVVLVRLYPILRVSRSNLRAFLSFLCKSVHLPNQIKYKQCNNNWKMHG